MKKRGQFFILAAVLIASIVFSLSIAKNLLIGSEKPEDFYVMGEQLDREIKAVLDYQLISGQGNISEFINSSMSYFNETKPYTEIIFLYLQGTDLYVENYANRSVYVSGFAGCSPCEVQKDEQLISPVLLSEVVNINIISQDFEYNLTKGSKSYIVLMRNVSREVYVDVKE